MPNDRPELTLETLIIELKANSENEREFAQRVAMVCAELADRSLVASTDETPSTAIRRVFRLK